MMRQPISLKKISRFILVLGLLALFNLLVHEFGHCVTLNRVKGKCGGVYIFPGIKIWPLTSLGQPYDKPDEWNQKIGLTQTIKDAPTLKANGLVKFMGSGSVAILSLVALVGLYMFRPHGWLRILLLAQSLMFIDLLTYTILPEWFNLNHFFCVGGDTPEPLIGARMMGIPKSVFISGVLVYSALMAFACLSYVRKYIKRE